MVEWGKKIEGELSIPNEIRDEYPSFSRKTRALRSTPEGEDRILAQPDSPVAAVSRFFQEASRWKWSKLPPNGRWRAQGRAESV